MPTKEEFLAEIRQQLRQAELRGATSLNLNAGELHRRLGGYPDGGKHQMPACCSAMYAEQKAGDRIVSAPPKGKGASLVIAYALPRGNR
jgi:5-methylcytosine-specific restriction protein A